MNEQQVLTTFGNNIRKLRQKLNLSQYDLALKAGWHRSYIWQVESGNKNITIQNVFKFAEILEVKPHELFEGM